MRLRRVGDEELAAARVGAVERDANGAAEKRPFAELVPQRKARAAGAVAARIAALNDEIGHDAVKTEAVEEILLRERADRVDRERRVEHGELDLNRAAV